MTVGTENLKIVQAVVGAISVPVMQLHAEWIASPMREPTDLTPVPLQTLREQTPLQVVAAGAPAANSQFLDQARTRPDRAALDGLVP
jgi:hypothetical protein